MPARVRPGRSIGAHLANTPSVAAGKVALLAPEELVAELVDQAHPHGGDDGHARDGVAFSDDPFTWRKGGQVLIDVGEEGSIDSQYAHILRVSRRTPQLPWPGQ